MSDKIVSTYEGVYNVSNIISSLRKIKDEVSKISTSARGQSLLGDFEKDLLKLDKMTVKLFGQMDRGFSNSKETKAFENNLNEIFNSLANIKSGLQNVSQIELGKSAKKAQKEYEKLVKEINKIKKSAKETFSGAIQKTSLPQTEKDTLKTQLQLNQLNTNALEKQIKLKQEKIKADKQELETLQKEYEINKKNENISSFFKGSYTNLTAVLGKNLPENTEFLKTKKGSNSISRFFSFTGKQETKELSNQFRALTDSNKYSTALFNKSALQEFSNRFLETIIDVVKNLGKEAKGTDVIKEYTKNLGSLGIQVTDVDNYLQQRANRILSNFRTSYDDIINKEPTKLSQQRESLSDKSKGIENTAQQVIQLNELIQAYNQMESELQQADDKLDIFQNSTDQETKSLKKLLNSLNSVENDIDTFGQNSAKVAENLEKTTKSSERVKNSFDNLKNSLAFLFSVRNIFYTIRTEIMRTYENIKQLDQAFGQIAMVTDFSIEDMWNKYADYAEIANEMGQTTLSVVQASGLYFQQGLKSSEALTLTASTMKLATLAGLDFQQATSNMTAAIRGFHMEMNEGERITDVYSELAANAAADVEGIATAISRTAAIAHSAGMEFETTSAMLTTMIEATQESPETLGTAMKTVIARFTELKQNIAGTDESEFDDLDLNKIDTALKSIGVQLKDSFGQFRDIDDVLLEVASNWDNLSRNTQRYIATISAGSRQQSRFIALMENYDRVMELVGIAQDSTGRSSEQFSKYADTLENKVNKLKNSWEQLKISFLQSDVFKKAIDLLNSFVKRVGEIDGKNLLGVGVISLTLGKTIIENLFNSLKNIGTNSIQIGNQLGNFISEGISESLGIDLKSRIIDLGATIATEMGIPMDAIDVSVKELIGSYALCESKINDLEQELIQNKNLDSEQNALIEQRIAKLRQEQQERRKIITSQIAGKQLGAAQDIDLIIDENSKVQRKTNQAKNAASSNTYASSLISNAIQGVVFAAITTSLTGADSKEAFKIGLISIITSTLPGLVDYGVKAALTAIKGGAGEALIKGLIGFFTGPVGIALAVAAIVGVVTPKIVAAIAGPIDSKEQYKKELKEAEKALEEASSVAIDNEAAAKSANDELKTLKELKEEYEDLSKIHNKTTDQQDKYNQLVEQIREDYPSLVENYNEQTGELKIQNDLWTEILDKAEKTAKVNNQRSFESNIRAEKATLESEQLDIDSQIFNLEQELSKLGDYNEQDFGRLSTAYNLGIVTREQEEQYKVLKQQYEIRTQLRKEISELQQEQEQKTLDHYKKIREIQQQYIEDTYNESEAISRYIDQIAYDTVHSGGFLASYAQQKGYSLNKDEIDFERQSVQDIIQRGLGLSDDDFEDWKEKTEKAGGLEENEWIYYLEGLRNLAYENSVEALESGLTDAQRDVINNFRDNLSKYTYDELSKGNLVTTGDTDFDNQIKEDIEEQKEKIKEILQGTDIGIDILDLLGLSDDNLGAWSEETANTLKNVLQVSVDQVGSSDSAKTYFTNLSQLMQKEGISQQDYATVIGSIDWTQASLSNWEDFRNKSIETLKGLGISSAEQFFDEWTEYAKSANIYADYFTDATAATQYAEQLKTTAQAIYDNQDAFEKFLQSREDSIKVDKSDIDSLTAAFDDLKEKGVSGIGEVTDYYKVVGDSFVVDAEKVRQLVLQNTEGAKEQLKVVKQVTDEHLKQLKIEKQRLENSLESTIRNSPWKDTTDLENQITAIQNQIDLLNELNNEYPETYSEVSRLSKEYAIFNETLSDIDYSNILSNLSSVIDSYSSLSDEMNESGHISAESISSLDESLDTLNTSLVQAGISAKYLDASSFLSNTDGQIKINTADLETYINTLISAIEKTGQVNDILYYQLLALKQGLIDTREAAQKAYDDEVQSAWEDYQDALDDVKEKQDAVREAQEKVTEALEKQAEAEQKLQEIYYGTDNYKSPLDVLYNYTTRIDQLESAATKAYNALSDLTSDDNISKTMEDYAKAVHDEVAAYEAENKVIKEYLNNQERLLDTQVNERLRQLEGPDYSNIDTSQFYKKINGRYYLDEAALASARLSDDIKNYIANAVQSMNDYTNTYEQNLDKIEQATKEWNDFYKNSRSAYINVENKVAEVLKKKDEEELKSVQDKYEGMKEADNSYIDALQESIDKQRRLRNLANEWDDLATQEKKLSLQRRDTSGANRKEILTAEQDIQKSRESLLDTAVDNIISNLQELYAEQEETRQAEIDYRQAILDNKNYVDEATAIINNWGSVEEAKEWFMTMDEEYIEASDATLEQLLEDVETYYTDVKTYQEARCFDIEQITKTSADEINYLVEETSETLTDETQRSLDEIMDQVDEAMQEGREAVNEAINNVNEARDGVTKALADVSQALEEARKKQEEYNAAIANQPLPSTSSENNNGTSQEDYAREIAINLLSQKKQGVGFYESEIQKASGYTESIYENILKDSDFHGVYDATNKQIFLFDSERKAQSFRQYKISEKPYNKDNLKAFKNGGLVNYTGPAWVDGTPSAPEAFLSAADTQNIKILTNVLSELADFRLNANPSNVSNIVGDSTFNININVESISDDYGVDEMVDRVRKDILDITNNPKYSVILHK